MGLRERYPTRPRDMAAPERRTETHGLSDSDLEVLAASKKKRFTKKSKMSATDTELPVTRSALKAGPPSLRPVSPLSLPIGGVGQPEMTWADMSKMFLDMKALTDRNTTMLAKSIEARHEADKQIAALRHSQLVTGGDFGREPESVGEECYDPAHASAPHSSNSVYSRYPEEYWEENEEEWEEFEGEEEEEDTADEQDYPLAPPVSLVSLSRKPGSGAHRVEPTPSTSKDIETAGPKVVEPAVKTKKTTKVYKLSPTLKEGTLLEELKEVYKKIKKPSSDRIDADNNLVAPIKHYYMYNKPQKVLKDLGRQYTGLQEIGDARAQPLNEEVRFHEVRKYAEEALMWATRGVVGALTAIIPTVALILDRGNTDEELNAQGVHMWDAVRLLVATHVQLNMDRLANVKKVVNHPLGKELIKRRKDVYGEYEEATEHLLGEDLADRNKKLMKSTRASDTVMNTSFAPRKFKRQQEYFPHKDFQNKRRRFVPQSRGRGNKSHFYNPRFNTSASRGGRGSDSFNHASTSFDNFPRAQRGRGAHSYTRGFTR